MSRRKQDKPQQVKRALTADEEESAGIFTSPEALDDDEEEDDDIQNPMKLPKLDTLKCGECQMNFALADIVSFIEHKKQGCKVAGLEIMGEDGPPDQDEAIVLRSEKPRITTPIKNRTPSISNFNRETNTTTTSKHQDQSSPESVDTENETTSPEPSKYVCTQCKQHFRSAWFVLQHAQHIHGMKIYLDNNMDISKESPPILQLEQPPPLRQQVPVQLPQQRPSPTPPPPPPPLPPSPPPLLQQRSPSPSLPIENKPLPLTIETNPMCLPVPTPIENNPFAVFLRPPMSEPTMVNSHESVIFHAHHHHPSPEMFRDAMQMERIRMERPLGRIGDHLGMPPDGPPPPPPPPPPPTTTTTSSHNANTGGEPSLDFYSQRLRQLAGTNSPTSPPLSPSKRKPGMHHRLFNFAPMKSAPTSNKSKSCEFCGKVFKFQSNLIVHRRSHTGEKPYKCQLCDHACSQASKLKRHMKTHFNKNSPRSVSSSVVLSSSEENDRPSRVDVPSASSVLKSVVNQYINDNKQACGSGHVTAEEEELEELTDNSGAIDLSGAGSSRRDSCNDDSSERSNGDSTGNHVGNHSLLSEVMQNSGLNEIQAYNEAYQQAIAESSRSKDGDKDDSMSKADSENEDTETETDMSRVDDATPERCESESSGIKANINQLYSSENTNGNIEEPIKKRIKLEPSSPLPPPRPPSGLDGLYSHWMPEASTGSTKDLFANSPATSESSTANGGSVVFSSTKLESEIDSPVKSDTSSRSKSPKGGGDKKSDTCEFCGKIFKNCSNLTVHRRSHTGEKPYKCELCSYACAQSSKLTRHMKTHGKGAKEVFRCEVCSMPFSVYSTLEKHMKKWHWGGGPKPNANSTNTTANIT
ncbi:BCL11 transcription factor A-like [Saccoglossus kowalevskii]